MTTPATSRSIFGPLVLIALGGLWLLSNFNLIAPANLWALFRFWPVLLIALGCDLLLRARWPWASNVIAFLTVTLAVLTVLFAPQLGLVGPTTGNWFSGLPWAWGSEPGSGQVVTKEYEVSDFDTVAFSAWGDLTIQQGETESLSIEAEDNVLAQLRVEVREGTLTIGFVEENGWMRVRPTRPIRLALTVKQLAGLTLAGAGSGVVQDLQTEELQATVSGTGSLSFLGLSANKFSCRLSGAGSLQAVGQATEVDVRVSGVGSYTGGDLQAETVNVNISSTGSAVVWATKLLDARISGLGSVDYYGQPEVTEQISGLGDIRPLGDK